MQVYHTKAGQIELFNTPADVNIEIEDFDRKVITEDFNQTVRQALSEHIGPSFLGKSLIFYATDSHADMVVRLPKEASDNVCCPVHDDTVNNITGASDIPSLLRWRYKNEQLPKTASDRDNRPCRRGCR